MKRRLAAGISTLLVIALLVGALIHRQLIRDFIVVHTTTLDSKSSTLKEKLDLTEKGDFLYKASQPKVQPAGEFNNSCKNVAHEHSIVLGCYTAQQIYIYDVNDERLDGVKEVTAAHELLHAVYERLPREERQSLNMQLTAVADTIENQRFKDTITEYRRTEPGQVENELHSILGTEIEVLPAELEEHYKKYFTNRTQIVSYAKQYEDAFTSLDQEISDYDQQLARLEQQKEQLEDSLANQQRSIEAEQDRLNALRSSDDRSAYNAAVPAYNAQIEDYNNSVAKLKQLVNEYNQIVVKRNALAATQNDLVKQLDSSYDPLD